jgi:hypothetical protein
VDLSDAEVQHPSAAVAFADDVDMAPVGEECARLTPFDLDERQDIADVGAPRRYVSTAVRPANVAVEPSADRKPAPVGQ